MVSTNFNNEIKNKINEVLKFSFENKYSNFYTDRNVDTSTPQIQSYEDFLKIPCLTKDDILQVELKRRTFVPKEEIVYYSFSSGTTNHLKPLIIPHNSYYHEGMEKYLFNKQQFKELGVNNVMILLQPTAALNFRSITMKSEPARFIPGDSKNLRLMAQVIKDISVEGILTTATVLDFLASEMQAINADFTQLKWIAIGGESCSSLRLDYFKKKFPKAFFVMLFGNSEIGGSRHYQCEYLKKKSHQAFHIDNQTEIVEIIDENNNVVPFETPGEIVHTDLKRKAFPLIRYKTKDIGFLSKDVCPCGETITLTIQGRSKFDVLKIYGTTFNSELIAQALKDLQPEVKPHFQFHIFEREINNTIKPEFEIHLELNDPQKKDNLLLEILAAKISKRIKLSQTSTLQDLVEQGYFLPLKVILIDNWNQEEIKSKNIITHF